MYNSTIKGLRGMFGAEIAICISVLLLIFSKLGLFALIALVVALFIYLSGLFCLSMDIKAVMAAFIITIIRIIIALLAKPNDNLIFSIIVCIIGIVSSLCIYLPISKELFEIDAKGCAVFGIIVAVLTAFVEISSYVMLFITTIEFSRLIPMRYDTFQNTENVMLVKSINFQLGILALVAIFCIALQLMFLHAAKDEFEDMRKNRSNGIASPLGN